MKQNNEIKKNISLFKPNMGLEEVEAVKKVLLSGWIGLGPKTEEFEKEFAKYTGAKYAVALNSCTSALHLAIKVAGIKKGDEVITTPLTFAASAEAILYNEATPVFADINEETLNIDPISVEKKITKKTKAILVVHYGGQPVELSEIQKIADKHNLIVIEDAAHACGASYNGKKIGSGENLTCFSFHAVKNLAAGDGGMITTNDSNIDRELRLLRWMGIDKSTHQRTKPGEYLWDYSIGPNGGYKYHMNDINAAIALVQLGKLDSGNKIRKDIAAIYDKAFKSIDGITPLRILGNRESSYHIYCIKINNINRQELMGYLSENGISTGVHYKPLYHHPRYAPYWHQDTPVVEKIWPNILSLPNHPGVTKEEVYTIARTIIDFKS